MGILYIDDSNHGNYPEIKLAFFAEDEHAAKKALSWLNKNKHKEITEELLSEMGFNFLVLERWMREMLGYNVSNIMSHAELIRTAKSQYGLDGVIIDGETAHKDILGIERSINGHVPKIQGIAHADQAYAGAKAAGKIAYRLYRHMARNSCPEAVNIAVENELNARKVDPNIVNYQGLATVMGLHIPIETRTPA